MEKQHVTIKHAYHFLSEAIIIFLALHPIVFQHYEGIPYLLYVGISGIVCLVFATYEYKDLRYLPFIISAPVIVIIYYWIGYPIGLSLVFAALLTWRYLAIRSELYLKREEFYLILTLVLTIIIMIFIRDVQVLSLLFVQLIILFTGNLLSHTAFLQKSERNFFNKRFWVSFGGVFLLLSLIIFLFSDILTFLLIQSYQIFGAVLIWIASQLAGLFEGLEIEQLQPNLEEVEIPVGEEKDVEELPSFLALVQSIVSTYIGIAFLIIISLLLYFVLKFRSRFKIREAEEVSTVEYAVDDATKSKVKPKSIFRKRKRKINHPVRKIIFEFEQKAAKYGKGRKPFETIEDWLERIGFGTNLEVYQRVRYAGMDVSEEEVTKLVKDINEMEKTLKVRVPLQEEE